MFSIFQMLSVCETHERLRSLQRIYKLADQADAETGFPFACTAIYLSTLVLSLMKTEDLKLRGVL